MNHKKGDTEYDVGGVVTTACSAGKFGPLGTKPKMSATHTWEVGVQTGIACQRAWQATPWRKAHGHLFINVLSSFQAFNQVLKWGRL
jgi:hypothetical protein